MILGIRIVGLSICIICCGIYGAVYIEAKTLEEESAKRRECITIFKAGVTLLVIGILFCFSFDYPSTSYKELAKELDKLMVYHPEGEEKLNGQDIPRVKDGVKQEGHFENEELIK